MFSQSSLALIKQMVDGVTLQPKDANFMAMAKAFEVLKEELIEAIKLINDKKENKDGND